METGFLANDTPTNEKKTFNKAGLLLVGVAGGAAVGLSILCYPFVSPALRKICLPYVPATTQQVSNVLQALNGRAGSLLDIGSGDGRIVFAAAKRGFQSAGVELNYWLVLYSRWMSLKNGVSKSTSFYHADLWKFHLKPYKNVVIFGVNEMMPDLVEKFDSELDDTYVVACRFPLPSKDPLRTIGEGIDKVWIYHFNKKIS